MKLGGCATISLQKTRNFNHSKYLALILSTTREAMIIPGSAPKQKVNWLVVANILFFP